MRPKYDALMAVILSQYDAESLDQMEIAIWGRRLMLEPNALDYDQARRLVERTLVLDMQMSIPHRLKMLKKVINRCGDDDIGHLTDRELACILQQKYADNLDSEEYGEYVERKDCADKRYAQEVSTVVEQECPECGKRFFVRYHAKRISETEFGDGSIEFLGKPCGCTAEFEPVDKNRRINYWIEDLNSELRWLLGKLEV